MASNGKVPRNLGWNNLYRGNVPPERFKGVPDKPDLNTELPTPEPEEAPKEKPKTWKAGYRRPPPPPNNIGAIQRAKKRDDEIAEMARSDPERVQEELYKELSVTSLRLTRKLNRAGGEPSRLLIESWREVRQAGLVVLQIRQSRGMLGDAKEFFETLNGRFTNLEEMQIHPIAELEEESA